MGKKSAKRILSATLACVCGACVCGCGNTSTLAEQDEFTVTVFSDVHHGDNNYNDFNCTRALEKLGCILDETPNSEFYINLGDMADYLKSGQITFYEEVAAFLGERNVVSYLPEKPVPPEGNRLIYNLMGNHETAYVPKSALADYIPYVDGIGSVYDFTYKNILFLAIDANFDRETQSDDCTVMRTSTKFIIPEKVLSYVLSRAAAEIDDGIKGIVWLSHIAFKDIENTSRFALVDALHEYGLPLTILEGHTHHEAYDVWTEEADPTKELCRIYTLPAVTSGLTYKYYNITFADGRVKTVDKHDEAAIPETV